MCRHVKIFSDGHHKRRRNISRTLWRDVCVRGGGGGGGGAGGEKAKYKRHNFGSVPFFLGELGTSF